VFVEQKLVEVVGQVVVMGNRRAVAHAGVQSAGKPGLAGRRARWRTDSTEARSGTSCDEPSARREPWRPRTGPRRTPGPPKPLGEIAFDVEVAGDVGTCESELTGCPYETSQRAT